MIWCYSQNQKRSSDFFRNVMSCRIELCEKARKNDYKNGIWNGHALSSSYAILFFRDIYWISLRMCGGIHTYVSFHACVCVTDYGNSCTNSASILFSISSGRAGKKSISVLFSTLSTVTIYFFSGLCPALLGKINLVIAYKWRKWHMIDKIKLVTIASFVF